MKLKTIVAAVAATASASAFAAGSMNDQVKQNGNIVNVHADAQYSQQVLSNQKVTGSVLDILNARKSGELASNAIYIGGKGEIYAQYQNVSNNNASLGSQAGNTNNNSNTAIELPYADVAITSTIGDWVTGFADMQVSNAATSTLKLPNAYFIVGNLDKSPFYGFGGKKVVDFGKFDSVTNFMPTLTRAYFMAYGGVVGAGYSQNGIDVVASFMNGKGLGMFNSQASSAQQLNNFALNGSYNGKAGNLDYYAGAGYINATGFSNSDTKNKMVGAFDLNGGVKIQGLAVNGEFLMTTQGVHGMNTTSVAVNNGATAVGLANNPDTAANTAFGFNALPALVAFGSDATTTVKAWSLDSSYTVPVAGKDMVPYVSYSQVAQNSDNNLYQLEVGTRYNLIDTIWVGGSYNYMSGKSAGTKVGKFNTVMLDATVYF
ncbi:hypothetical protein [Facilibium subflavum]|uniref:hypothetical protein n=1 Tax=Facilibium subflavum TaxID=2219058 RepID=UPI000E64D81C|nr:hypothetical protein [Facilibium subflavum]